ncbi:hypothetical protein DAEQUDRAFT_362451 [Daedalea quercina L-15889]|uniref:Uncharacterized protein n=1 Tax=Daedalea quercina L-15889 TaxID=1314783 RepID=A0A165TTW5_9APHY|nr:hypothetical protein DAEQUDRAFT_362451 [Daedalea quercina L-15889]
MMGLVKAYTIYVSYVAVAAALYFTFGLVAALRVYAINGLNWRLPAFILVLSLLGPATDVVHCVYTYRVAAPPPVGCIIGLSNSNLADKFVFTCEPRLQYIHRRCHRLQIATRACNAAVDALVLFTTWRVTYHITRVSRSTGLKTSITTLLLRDGSIYFGILLILNILNATLWLTDVYQNMTVFSDVFSIVLLSHFLLNLRKTALNPDDSTTVQASDLRFTSALGDLGSAVAEGSAGLEWFEDNNESYELSETYVHTTTTGREARTLSSSSWTAV